MTQYRNVEGSGKRGHSGSESVPLVVDLDGTLLRTDLLLESGLPLIKQRPWLVLFMPLWLLRGRAYLKRKIFQRVQIDVSLLPLHEELLTWLRDEKARGRRLILATASDYQQACSVVAALGLFDTVLGSDGQRNLKGREKLKTIVDVCGEKFDYVGNSSADLVIWRDCRHAILVNTSRRVERSARRAGNVLRVFPSSLGFQDILHSMRFYQWVKNLLLFVPAITSHTIFNGPVAGNATLAFFSFGFAASAAYILNDLLDLEEDRRHATKKQRPFASGRMLIGSGIVLAIASLSASAAIASLIPGAFVMPAALATGCRIVPGVRAEKLERAGTQWRVQAVRQGEPLTIGAEAVFVCCGAIETPALLRRSRIKKNIGNSLAFHPTVKVVAVFEDEINGELADIGAQQVKEFSPRVSMGCSISSLPYLALAMTDHPDAKVNLRRQWRRMSIYYAMISGPTTGVVRNVPLSPAPLIRYSLSAEDLRDLSTALVNLCRLLFAAGATHLYPGIAELPVLASKDDLTKIPLELPRDRTSLMTAHLFSSCPMGQAADLTAVDSFGQVHGYRNLFVNDASLLCTAPGVNPQGSIMALARRNALHFSKDL